MKDFPLTNRQEPEISGINPGMDEIPLWLMQKDDSPVLYLSLLLSVAVHIVLFIVLAATRIFHPFAGASQEFDLVWFSPAPAAAPMQAPSAKQAVTSKGQLRKIEQAPPLTTKTSPEKQLTAKTPPAPPVKNKSAPALSPPKVAATAAPPPTTEETPTEEPAEMVISRFGGKVVEVVDKKAKLPTFAVISSVKVKSLTARAVVQTIRETGKESPKIREATSKVVPAQQDRTASQPTERLSKGQNKPVAVASAVVNPAKADQGVTRDKAVPPQGAMSSSAVAAAAPKQPRAYPAVNRSLNSLAVALNALSAAGKEMAGNAPPVKMPGKGTAGTEKAAAPQGHPLEKPLAVPTTAVPPVVQAEEKPAAKIAEKPKLVLHPPLVGDLKLVITGDVELKVETFFRPYPKNRRSKPFTRREAENRRNVPAKTVRIKENVNEAVVEIAEEGIYFIMVQSDKGKPVTAEFVLKIKESRPGAVTKKLGSKTITGSSEVARVLMPEGILWNDDSYFTGDMEDSDSITKFHSGSGLMWREYK